MKYALVTVLLLCAVLLAAQDIITVKLPSVKTVELKAKAHFQLPAINESSAMVRSRNLDGVFWTLNDSGDSARIFPFRLDGSSPKPEWAEDYQGIAIPDAVNIDWEDMAVDGDGNLVIGACGNNDNVRRDLALYVGPEPHPLAAVTTRYLHKYSFRYPDQDGFPPTLADFDCEAVFCAGGHIYLLTKHRSDTNTKLYRFDDLDPTAQNVPTLLATFAIGGMVTAADCTPDGRKLAVLTYNNIWIFEVDGGDDWFHGRIRYMPISAKQCEGICWVGDQLYITNEQTEIIEVPMDKFVQVQ